MNKKFITLIYTCIFVFFFCEGNAQQFNNDDVKVEVLLSNAMLKSFSMDIKFINSIDYTIGDYLLLASSNQFYILGMGGIESLFKRQKQSIDAYTITSKGTLFAICRKELCVIDTNNVLSKLFTLPNNAMGIVSGSKGLYVFDKNNLNGESSIYIVFEDARHAKLITVPMPIRSLLESEENLFFSSENKLFCIDVKNKKITELYSFPKKEDRIISMANDSLSHALYFSTNESIYRIINNEIEIINTDFGGTLRYDGEGLLIFNPEKSLIVRLRNSLLYPPEIKKPAIPPIDPANYLSDEKLSQLSLPKLRQLVLQNRISEAVSGYSQLVAKQAVNLELLAEYAYALALSGAYDCALMNLDKVRLLSPHSVEGRFYTALVFSLMGYNDMYTEFIKNIPDYKRPQWISYDTHLKLSKTRSQTPQLNHDDGITAFRRVNYLAAAGLYLQSIALYEEIIKTYSTEFFPHVGYSIVLEKVGFYPKALQALESGIALMPDSLRESKTVFEKRKTELSQKINAPNNLKNKILKLNDEFRPQTMLYVGGMATESSFALNSRFGLFLNNTFNGAIDFGMLGGKEFFNVNLGTSVYQRFFDYFVWGEGVNLQTGTSTVFSLKSTFGLSFINRQRNSSWDFFFDYYLPIGSETKGIFGISIGKSIYFGKRK